MEITSLATLEAAKHELDKKMIDQFVMQHLAASGHRILRRDAVTPKKMSTWHGYPVEGPSSSVEKTNFLYTTYGIGHEWV